MEPFQEKHIWASLFEELVKLAPDVAWRGQDTLLIGCQSAYALRHLVQHAGVASAHGIDMQLYGNEIDEHRPEGCEKIFLHEGEVTTAHALQELTFDVMLSCDSLMMLSFPMLEANTRWMLDHLREGGSALIRVTTILSHAASGYRAENDAHSPYRHLLFTQPVLEEASHASFPLIIPYCTATWGMHFFQYGFEVVNMVRQANPFPEIRTKNKHKLRHYAAQEIATDCVLLHVRKPSSMKVR